MSAQVGDERWRGWAQAEIHSHRRELNGLHAEDRILHSRITRVEVRTAFIAGGAAALGSLIGATIGAIVSRLGG